MSNESSREMPPEKINRLTPEQLKKERAWTGRALLQFIKENPDAPIHIHFSEKDEG